MAKQNDTGVYQKSNGYWEYRFRQKVNGKMITHKKTTDAQGNKLKTKKEAVAAREAALVAARASSIDAAPPITRRTAKQVFEEFCEHGRKDRAYQTIRKQDMQQILLRSCLKMKVTNTDIFPAVPAVSVC